MTKFPGSLTEPLHVLAGPQLDELELLLGGLYSPATGYCLPSDVPADWPWAFSLAVSPDVAAAAVHSGAVLLTDPDGTPLARLSVSAAAPCAPAQVHLAGILTALQPAEHPPARQLRRTSPLGATHNGRPTVVAVFSREPEPAELARAVAAARTHDAQLELVALTGSQTHGSYTVLNLISALGRCAAGIPDARHSLLITPAPAGATGLQRQALDEYVLARLGADILLNFSSIEPAARQAPAGSGAVVFLTGLSGSGKSTIARSLAERLQECDNRPVTLLDGDDVRRMLSLGLGFSREDRELNVRRIGWVASLIAKSGGVAVCAPIAPFEATRQEVRSMAEAAGSFALVHVSTSLEVCEQRDRKGLYARARAGSLPDFTGIDSPYETPAHADVVVDTSATTIDASVALILAALGIAPIEPRTTDTRTTDAAGMDTATMDTAGVAATAKNAMTAADTTANRHHHG
ncbi:adenylyl-sulfate kinase [Paenarthrobacter sp. Z7-10]|uniref:adenylyl-sulfate kinase n=1 Tax=Paenarthrobacter sp. Z7-10 TaxID=2787635 RepID=UPI0022A9E789|nr:adenylyl-sulfate kinase [Paenarthrobacter sp. Z7-10]MCZ2402959.1 adenylyl-sulfate kinase [Paenarthrobacter sp. Z7-10]